VKPNYFFSPAGAAAGAEASAAGAGAEASAAGAAAGAGAGAGAGGASFLPQATKAAASTAAKTSDFFMMFSLKGWLNAMLEPPHLGVAEPMDSGASSTQPMIIG
jgi:hypothetical protein